MSKPGNPDSLAGVGGDRRLLGRWAGHIADDRRASSRVSTVPIARSESAGAYQQPRQWNTLCCLLFRWTTHQSGIRHCDERGSAPSGFDEAHPSVPAAATMTCRATSVVQPETRQLACIGGGLFAANLVLSERSVAPTTPAVRTCRYLTISVFSTNPAAQQLLFHYFMDNRHYP